MVKEGIEKGTNKTRKKGKYFGGSKGWPCLICEKIFTINNIRNVHPKQISNICKLLF